MHRHTGHPGRRSVLAMVVGVALLVGSGSGAAYLETPPMPEDQATGTDESTDDPHDSAVGTEHDGAEHDASQHEGGEHGGPDDAGHSTAKLSCSDIDPTWSEVALTGHPLSGHYQVADTHRSVEFFVHDASAGGKLVNWSSDGALSAVILRSGQDAATYEYEPPSTSASGLQPPLVDRDGRNLAAVIACYQLDVIDVGIDVQLSDSSDPVDVGDQFAYVLEVAVSDFLIESSVVLQLAPEVSALDIGDCALSEREVRCAPPLDEAMTWATTITVEAVDAGVAISSAHLHGGEAEDPVSASALEVTRIVGRPGSGGACGGHEAEGEPGGDHDVGNDTGSDHEDEGGCGDDKHGLEAACAAVDPGAHTILLQGPFASRRYQATGPGGTELWVEVGETTGAQMASWRSNVPVDAVLARTGREIEVYVNTPPALEGSGVVGPMSGSGPRPMADLAFCVIERPAVDVSIDISSAPTIPLLETRVLSVAVFNGGRNGAVGLKVGIEPNEYIELRSCGDESAVDGRCAIADIPPLGSSSLEIRLRGVAVGVTSVTFFVTAENEAIDRSDDNTAAIEVRVVGRTTSASSDTTVEPTEETAASTPAEEPTVVLSADAETEPATDIGPDAEPPTFISVQQDTLPFTGSVDLGWTVAAGTSLIVLGAVLLLGFGAQSTRPRRRRQTGPGALGLRFS